MTSRAHIIIFLFLLGLVWALVFTGNYPGVHIASSVMVFWALLRDQIVEKSNG